MKIDKYDFYKKEYKDCFEFTQDYERTNPISKKEGKIIVDENSKDRSWILVSSKS